MSKVLTTVLFAGFATAAMADVAIGPYVGGNLGGGWMSGKKSLTFDFEQTNDFFFYNNKGCFGGGGNFLIGYRDKLEGLNMGGELSLGYSLYKQTLSDSISDTVSTYSMTSTVKRDWNTAVVGIAGYDFGNICVSGKLGLGVARFVHEYKEVEDDNETLEYNTLSSMAPALVTGLLMETDLTPSISLRAEYTLWIHSSADSAFEAEETNELTVRQKIVSPKVQSFTIGAVYHF